MVEYSAGYKAKADMKLQAVDRALKPKTRAVARGLSGYFVKSSTKAVDDKSQEAAGVLAAR